MKPMVLAVDHPKITVIFPHSSDLHAVPRVGRDLSCVNDIKIESNDSQKSTTDVGSDLKTSCLSSNTKSGLSNGAAIRESFIGSNLREIHSLNFTVCTKTVQISGVRERKEGRGELQENPYAFHNLVYSLRLSGNVKQN